MNDHMIKTTQEWQATSMLNKIIGRGVLCIEIGNDGMFSLKIGDGKRTYPNLPYVYQQKFITLNNTILQVESALKQELTERYTKSEVDAKFTEIREIIEHMDFSMYITQEQLEAYTQPFTLEEKEKLANLDTHDYSTDIEAVNQRIDDLDFSEYAKKEELHQHDNKIILDETTASFTVTYKNILDNWVSSDYATVQYVDDKIADIVIPDIDLSEYAKKTWVIDKIEEIIPPDAGIQDIQVKQNDVGVLVSTKPNSITEDLDVFQYLNVMTINCGFSDT